MSVLYKGSLPFYLLIGLLQGLGVLMALEAGWAGAVMAVLVIGINLQLLGAQARQRATWPLIAILALIMGALTQWLWPLDGSGHRLDWLREYWIMSAILVGYITTAFIVSWPSRQGWRVPYQALFRQAWNHAFILALALLLTGLFWGLLFLCASLFEMVGIEVLMTAVKSRPFLCFSLAVVFSLGIRMGCESDRVIGLLRGILLSLCHFLTPLAALIIVLFTVVLPFTGLESIWQTGRATGILLWLIFITLYLVNGVFQDGDQAPAYPRRLLQLINVSLLCLPILALLAAYSLWLRIDQYGLSPSRGQAVVLVLFALLHSLALLVAVLRRKAGWLGSLKVTNPILALLLCMILVLMHTPWLNPQQLSARDQVQRLLEGRTLIENFDADYLVSELGEPGYQTAVQLRAGLDNVKQLDAQARELLRRRLQEALTGQSGEPKPAPVSPVWIGTPVDGHEQFSHYPFEEQACSDHECFLWATDLDGDGQSEVLLIPTNYTQMVFFQRNAQGQWHKKGSLHAYVEHAKLIEQIRAGKARVVRPHWNNLEIEGQIYTPIDTRSR